MHSLSMYHATVEWIAIGEFSAILFPSTGVATSAPNPECGAIKWWANAMLPLKMA